MQLKTKIKTTACLFFLYVTSEVYYEYVRYSFIFRQMVKRYVMLTYRVHISIVEDDASVFETIILYGVGVLIRGAID